MLHTHLFFISKTKLLTKANNAEHFGQLHRSREEPPSTQWPHFHFNVLHFSYLLYKAILYSLLFYRSQNQLMASFRQILPLLCLYFSFVEFYFFSYFLARYRKRITRFGHKLQQKWRESIAA